MIKKIIKKSFDVLGYKIQKKTTKKIVSPDKGLFTMQSALERCSKRGLDVRTVIDVGASDGRWSRDCMKVLPNANYFLVEAQEGHEKGLRSFKNEQPKVDYIIAAAGRTDGKIYFNNDDLFGGLASETPLKNSCIEIPVIILDNEIKKRNLEPPYLLKLDTHGFEVPILEGAKNIIKSAQLIIIETYNYRLTDESFKYYEMCSYMEKLGFSTIEMVDLMLRKYDDTFWQMDTFFVPGKNENFEYNSYK